VRLSSAASASSSGKAPKNDGSISASSPAGAGRGYRRGAALVPSASATNSDQVGVLAQQRQEPRAAVQSDQEAVERGERAVGISARAR